MIVVFGGRLYAVAYVQEVARRVTDIVMSRALCHGRF